MVSGRVKGLDLGEGLLFSVVMVDVSCLLSVALYSAAYLNKLLLV